MDLISNFEDFAAEYAKGTPQCVAMRLVSDLETTISSFLKLKAAFPQPSILLESVEGGAQRGRYSIIGLAPDAYWKFEHGSAETAGADLKFTAQSGSAFEALRAFLAKSAIPADAALPPMANGTFGFLGYDMVRQMERLPAAKPDILGVPDALLMRPTLVLVFDALKDEVIVITPVRPQESTTKTPVKAAWEAAIARLERVLEALEAPLPHGSLSRDATAPLPQITSNTSPEKYKAMVAAAKEYILSGDIFQVVLSQRFSSAFTLPPFSLYRALRRTNPSPYLCYVDFNAWQIVCSSPEILVKSQDGEVTIRPIAGTRPRGKTPAEDLALEQELLADPKECAEHLMLLDLGRNDVGRVSEIGTVKVTDRFFVERYSQVMHIVSNVTGKQRQEFDGIDALIAGFPAGTVSGAPKIRAMEIIDEIERDKRGPYGGCIGYFSGNGNMDSCIVLRTAIVKDGMMHVQAGAGIVHDSNPQSEQTECENKAKALFRAAEEAVRFAARSLKGQ